VSFFERKEMLDQINMHTFFLRLLQGSWFLKMKQDVKMENKITATDFPEYSGWDRAFLLLAFSA